MKKKNILLNLRDKKNIVNIEKSNKVKATLKATKERRKTQQCKVFELKIDVSHLNKKTKEDLKLIFLEAKWLYNFALSSENVFDFPKQVTKVQVKVKDVFEERTIEVLGSQMKQGVIDQLKQNILNLSKKKKKGGKVGRLKYKTQYESINLKQFGVTYQIEKNKIKIQGIKQWIWVRGIDQIKDKGFEFANAKLVKKPSGYYLKVTCYKEKEIKILSDKPQIGLDFGIKTQIALSNGIEINYQIEPPVKQMRKKYQDLSKKKPYSENWYKAKNELGKEYEKINNIKKDVKNKLVHILKNEFSFVGFQDESIKAWQKIWGKRILNTAIGGITASLRKTPTAVQVDKFFPSTKQCPCCDNKEKLTLSERVFVCSKCGYTKSRDWKSADMILGEALRKVGVERTELAPLEMRASTLKILGKFNAIPRVKASSVAELGSPSHL